RCVATGRLSAESSDSLSVDELPNRGREMGHDWDFATILSGYEYWWIKGVLVTIAYATGKVLGGLIIGV
ncbi:MAG: hypothetical protein ACKVK8_02255, partial [Rhodospirillales bacterium]